MHNVNKPMNNIFVCRELLTFYTREDLLAKFILPRYEMFSGKFPMRLMNKLRQHFNSDLIIEAAERYVATL